MSLEMQFARRLSAARLGICLVLALLAWLSHAPFAAANEYRLGPLDKIKVKVSEWRPLANDTFDWSALNGEFTINSVGLVSIPLIGSMHVQDATTSEVADHIADRLKALAGLIKRPPAAVEISQYRPFYIVGVVDKPGEYAFRPGMNVIQAVSIAGGFFRPEVSLNRFERETIVTEGDIKVSQLQYLALTIRRDRLLSESQGHPAIAFSNEILQRKNDRLTAEGIAGEEKIFLSRQSSARSQEELLVRTKSQLEEELKTLGLKSVAQQKQFALIKKELDTINSLVSRGLAVSPRQLSVEQNLAQLESQMLDLILATARTKQDIGRTELNLVEQKNLRTNEILKELRETQLSLQQTTERIQSLKMLVYDSQVIAPRQQIQQASELMRLRFTIMRRQRDGVSQEIDAQQSDAVLPGDIIKIERPIRENFAAIGGAPVSGN